MKNRIYTLMALAVAVTCAYGQNMAIYKAQAKIDENKLKEAEEIITPALTNPKTTKLAEMYNLAGSIQIRFLQPELIKAAQQQPCDTALFVSSLEKAVQYYTKSNEYDMQPDKKVMLSQNSMKTTINVSWLCYHIITMQVLCSTTMEKR